MDNNLPASEGAAHAGSSQAHWHTGVGGRSGFLHRHEHSVSWHRMAQPPSVQMDGRGSHRVSHAGHWFWHWSGGQLTRHEGK